MFDIVGTEILTEGGEKGIVTSLIRTGTVFAPADHSPIMLELNHGFHVVDVRAHLRTPTDRASGRSVTAEDLEREMHHAGIVRSVVAPAPGTAGESGYVKANNAVARQSIERPLAALSRIDGPRQPGRSPGAMIRSAVERRQDTHVTPEDVEQFGYDDRFHGFALDPTADGIPDQAVLEVIDEVGLPLFVYGGTGFPPERIESALLPRSVPVIVGHFGGHPLNRSMMSQAIGLLDTHDELYLDTAAVRYRGLLERAIREHPDRILFGSGTPDVHPGVGVMEILTLNVPEDAMARVLSGNAARIIETIEPRD